MSNALLRNHILSVFVESKAHAPYYIYICGLSASTTFFHVPLLNGTISGKKLLNTNCVFWFSVQLFWEIFLILGIIQRDEIS